MLLDRKVPFVIPLLYAPDEGIHQGEGKITLSFDVRLEDGADAAHEWRDDAHPYRAGPSIRIGPKGKLTAGGKGLASVPIGKWFRIEITCPLGKKSTGTYDLTLTLPAHAPKTFKRLPCRSQKFTRLEWLGLTSLANAKAAFYIDNVKLTPAK